MQRDERPEEYLRERKRNGSTRRYYRRDCRNSVRWKLPRNLFRVITTSWNDHPLKCYFVNDIFAVIGDICDSRA